MDRALTVLIVEHRALYRFLLRRALEKRGFEVSGARSKLEAADILSQERVPDALVLGDFERSRNGSYRFIFFPNAGAQRRGARLSGSTICPDLPTPTTAGDIAVELETLLRVLRDASRETRLADRGPREAAA